MKLFIYKCLIFSVIFFILFQITIGLAINKIEEKIVFLKSEEFRLHVKEKVKKELTSAIKKDQYLNDEDSKLIKDFLDKIKKELNN